MSRRDLLKWSGVAVAGAWLPNLAWAAEPTTADGAPLVGLYVAIGADNWVTITCPAAEIGQGVTTSLSEVIVEEMDGDWARVRYVLSGAGEAFANPAKGYQAVGRSMSVRGYWPLLRRLGATARQRLVEAAATRWSVPAGEVEARQGVLLHPPSNRTLTFGDVAAAAAAGPMPAKVKLKDPATFRLVGKQVARLDVPQKVDGTAVYGLDVKVPEMLCAAVATAPAVGGELSGFDEAAAKGAPGVRLVMETKTGLAPGLAICADTYAQALRALELANPRWTAGPNAGMTTETLAAQRREALAGDGLTVVEKGPVKSAFVGQVVEGEYDAPYLAHACMEPMTAVAHVHADGCTLWIAAQGQMRVRDAAAKLLGIPSDKVVVNTVLAGGGFGRRWQIDYAMQAVEISKAAGRPVKLIWSREEDFMHDWYRPAVSMRFRGALGDDGTLKAMEVKLAGDSLLEWGKPRPAVPVVDATSASGISDTGYQIATYRTASVTVPTPIPVGMWRSVGHSQNIFFMESAIDELAAAAKVDPLAFRRALLTDRPRQLRVLEKAAALSGWGTPKADGVGRGIAVCEAYDSIVAQVIEVEVAADTVKVRKVSCAIDCGRAVAPDGVLQQMEGGVIFALSAAFTGDIGFEGGAPQARNFTDNMPLLLGQCPDISVAILESDSPIGGAGEPGVPCVAPALLNAVFDASGKRIRALPLARAGLGIA